MHTLLPSIVFCVLAQTAAAQCVNPATATPVSAQVRPTAELISTAEAGTRDAPALHRTSVTETAKASPGNGEERHRSTPTAMLLAAVALMSGIALRRASASGQ